MKIFGRFLKSESGATAIEYGLIAALISLAVIAGFTLLSEPVGGLFSGVASVFANIEL